MSDNKKWRDVEAEILSKLDIKAEYEAMGVEFTGAKANSRGYWTCRRDKNDKHPSCGVQVGEAGDRGRFKDFAGSKSYSLFNYCVEVAGKFKSRGDVFKHYSEKTGVKLPKSEEKLVRDKFDLSPITSGQAAIYARNKPGVSAEAVLNAGAIGCRSPKNMSSDKQQVLIAFPMFGEHLLDSDPTGYHVVSYNGGTYKQYKGKGEPAEDVKVLTHGEPGLMNSKGLDELDEAEVVWIVEGLSDMLAGNTALLKWLEDTQGEKRRQKHVVITAGGVSYHPKPEWQKFFIGKDCRVVFDNDLNRKDNKNPGQEAAQVWVNFLLQVASSVKNVILPPRTGGGKVDLRRWFAGLGDDDKPAEGLKKHDFADLISLSEEFEVIEKAKPAENVVSREEAMLSLLGITVAGEVYGTRKIEAYSSVTQKLFVIDEIDKLSSARLCQHCGIDVIKKYVADANDIKNGTAAGKFTVQDVKMAIAGVAAGKCLHDTQKFGCGVWRIGGDKVLVKNKEALVLKDGKFESHTIPFYKESMLDLSVKSGNWTELGQLQEFYDLSANSEWSQGVFEEIEGIAKNWYWKQPVAPRIIASLIMCSWVQYLWRWRPQIFITGSTNIGKTQLLQTFVANGIFGEYALYRQKSTAAGYYQEQQHHGRLPIIDEFENSNEKQSVLNFFRVSGKGGIVPKGTPGGRVIGYRAQHIPWFAAIDTGLKSAPDRNRFIIFDMDEIPKGKPRGLNGKLSEARLRVLGQKALAVALRYFDDAQALADALMANSSYEGVDARIIENFSVPCGMISAIYGDDQVTAQTMFGKVLGYWDFSVQSIKDEFDLLDDIFTSVVLSEDKQQVSIDYLISRYESSMDARQTLSRCGIRFVDISGKDKSAEPSRHLFMAHKIISKEVLKQNNQPNSKSVLDYLRRIPGAVDDSQRLNGDHVSRGVSIPLLSINKQFSVT